MKLPNSSQIDPEIASASALAYALWDSEHPVRMEPNQTEFYIEKAKTIKYWLRLHGYTLEKISTETI